MLTLHLLQNPRSQLRMMDTQMKVLMKHHRVMGNTPCANGNDSTPINKDIHKHLKLFTVLKQVNMFYCFAYFKIIEYSMYYIIHLSHNINMNIVSKTTICIHM